jgi:large subunit ribosomal protein L9
MRRARDLREAADRESAVAISNELAKHTIVIKAKAGNEGRLFGSVSANDIVAAVLSQTGMNVDRKAVTIATAIRSLGDHQVSVEMIGGVTGVIKLSVVAK